MDPRQLLVGRFARRHDFDAAVAPAGRHGVENLGAFRALGMAGRCFVIRESFGLDERQGHGSANLTKS